MGTIEESSMNALFKGLTSPDTESAQPTADTEILSEQTDHEEKTTEQPSFVQKKKPGKKVVKEGFLVRFNKENLDKTRLIAFNNGLPISDVIDYALNDFIERYEKKNGRIKTKGRKVNVTELL